VATATNGGGITETPPLPGLSLAFDASDSDLLSEHLARAYAVIEPGLPRAVEADGGTLSEAQVSVQWLPAGRRTLMPPVAYGQAIYSVGLLIGRYLETGEALAQIQFSDLQTSWGLDAPDVTPTSPYIYRMDPSVFDKVIEIIFDPSN
jgi:hypothetical protein